jgi:hypothetical protein
MLNEVDMYCFSNEHAMAPTKVETGKLDMASTHIKGEAPRVADSSARLSVRDRNKRR